VAWLAISWSVLRLEPAAAVKVAGSVVLFGALTEALRSLSGTRTWWLNAGMAGLFAVTGLVLLASRDATYATSAALIGWYLMVRGAADVAVATMTRESDRVWGLLIVVGVLETALGFYAASPLSRAADLVVVTLGGLALARGVADLVTALRLRELSGASPDAGHVSRERASGLAGYSAGLADYESARERTGPRHRAAASRTSAAVAPSADGTGSAAGNWDSVDDDVLRTTADLDAMLALASVTGAGVAAGMAGHLRVFPGPADGVEDTSEMAATAGAAPEVEQAPLPVMDGEARPAHSSASAR
jgi:uncharacterized membrane protein HdeD (DUF308 family)